MYYHIVLGNKFSTLLSTYLQDANLLDQHQLLTLFDDLSFGPLRDETLPFSALRDQYWSSINTGNIDVKTAEIDDLERLIALRNRMVIDSDLKLVFWLENHANNLIYYYLVIHYFKHFSDRLYTINTTGLPFLDEQLRLFYPSQLFQIPHKELRKVLRLIRPLTKSEIEADADEFSILQSQRENLYRIYANGKSITFISYNDFGEKLFHLIPNEPTKIKKLISLWQQEIDSIFAPIFYHFFIHDLKEKGLISVENNAIIKI